MDENNLNNQGSLDKEKIEQLEKEMENIGSKPTQEISSQPSQPVYQPGTFDPPPPVAPEETNSQGLKKSKGILWIGIALLILALVGVGAYYLGSNKAADVPTPTTSAIQTPTPTPDPTTDWKIFENTVYKYIIKHPLDWTVSALFDMDPTKFREPVFNSKCDYEAGELCQQFFIDVVETNTATDLKPSFIIKEDDIVANEQSLIVNGQNAISFERYQTNYNNVPGTLSYVVVTNNNGLKYTIFYSESKKDKEFKTGNDWENRKLFDQILSTFKFIEVAL